jgi:organic radical activating enzyme
VLSLVTDGLSVDTYIDPLPTLYLSPCFNRVDVVKLVEAVKRISKAQQVFKVGLSLQLHKIIWEPNKRAV